MSSSNLPASHPPIAIIGAGLGGLSAAIHLRVRGHEVTVFEKEDAPGGRASRIVRDGFTFDVGPSLLNYPWVFEALFAAAGKRLSDYVELLPVDPSVAYQWPGGERLELTSQYDQLRANLEALEPGAGLGLARFFRDAHAKYTLSFDKLVTRNADNPLAWLGGLSFREMLRTSVWRSLYGELGRFFRNPRIREAFGAYGMYLGGSPFDLPGIFSILAYGELAYGLWLPKGGVYGLVEGMANLAKELGVHIRCNTPMQAIQVKDGAVRGLKLANGETEDWRLVVSNVDAPTTNTQLVDDKAFREAAQRKVDRIAMTPSVYTFYWGIQRPVEGIGHHTIFLPDDYRGAFTDLFKNGRLPAGLPFYTSVASATDPGLAPPNGTSVFVLAPAPLLNSENGHADAVDPGSIRERVLTRLNHHGVDLSEADIHTETVYTPTEWRDRFGLYRGSAFGEAHTLFQMGPWRSPNYARGIEGLYYVGAGVPPGTGMPMVVLSGQMTAERIASHAR